MWETSDKFDWTLDDEKHYKEGLLNRLSTTNESIKEKFPWSNELQQEIKLLETTNPLSIEDALENNEEIFGKIRAAQKKNGDIFLYGKPTPKIMDIMIKLYHENIFRVLKGKYEKKDCSKMMCGIVELTNGEIYVTLSESPYDGGNDSEYPKKIMDFYSLLKNGGINVTYPENEANIRKKFPSLIPSNLFPQFGEGWHESKSNNYIYSPANLSTKGVDYGTVFKEMFIDNVDNKLNKIKLNKILTNCYYEVKLIHSLDYLNIRKSNLDMASQNKNPFVPFIRRFTPPNLKEPQPYIYCNNGSTCVESKLFSYIYDTLHLKFEDIAGFVSYWIGGDLPPNHIIGSYCYKSGDENPEENRKLEGMLDECIGFLNNPPLNINDLPTCNIYNDIITTQRDKYDPTTIHNIMKNVVQPIALACPGCLSNYYYYTQNKRDQPFNYNICYGNWKKKRSKTLPETSMEDMVSSGGRRKTKTHRRKSKTHRRKSKTHRKKTKTRRRFT